MTRAFNDDDGTERDNEANENTKTSTTTAAGEATTIQIKSTE